MLAAVPHVRRLRRWRCVLGASVVGAGQSGAVPEPAAAAAGRSADLEPFFFNAADPGPARCWLYQSGPADQLLPGGAAGRGGQPGADLPESRRSRSPRARFVVRDPHPGHRVVECRQPLRPKIPSQVAREAPERRRSSRSSCRAAGRQRIPSPIQRLRRCRSVPVRARSRPRRRAPTVSRSRTAARGGRTLLATEFSAPAIQRSMHRRPAP